MIVENVSSEFLTLEDPFFVFSDDSRFIYMIVTWGHPLSISVFDIKYNKFITLLPDTNVINLLTRLHGFTDDVFRPPTLIINTNTLLILFNGNYTEAFEGCSLLVVAQLNFSDGTFSIIDHKVIKDCHHNSDTRLIKNGNKFLLVHHFSINKEEFVSNDEFLGYYTFVLHDDKRLEFQENRVIFDFGNSDSRRYFGMWLVYENRLWVVRPLWPRVCDYQLSYFDLEENNPKENEVEVFDGIKFNLKFQRCDNFIIKYCEHYHDERETENEGEFMYFDVSTSQWSRAFQRDDLLRIEKTITDAKLFTRLDTMKSGARRHFDSAFNAFIFDKTKKQLQIVPFKTPLKLLDIAWITALNNGLLNELDKRKIIIYPKFF